MDGGRAVGSRSEAVAVTVNVKRLTGHHVMQQRAHTLVSGGGRKLIEPVLFLFFSILETALPLPVGVGGERECVCVYQTLLVVVYVRIGPSVPVGWCYLHGARSLQRRLTATVTMDTDISLLGIHGDHGHWLHVCEWYLW